MILSDFLKNILFMQVMHDVYNKFFFIIDIVFYCQRFSFYNECRNAEVFLIKSTDSDH